MKQKSMCLSYPAGTVRLPPAIGRNAPCPCGSGKKWKKCHGLKLSNDLSAKLVEAQKAPPPSLVRKAAQRLAEASRAPQPIPTPPEPRQDPYKRREKGFGRALLRLFGGNR